MRPDLKSALLERACAPYRATGTFNFRWARGKLGGDPIFAALLDSAILPDGARVLDLGCGRGLLAAWFLAAERMALDNTWHATPQPPRGLQFRGIERLAAHAACGAAALAAAYPGRAEIRAGDLRDQALHDCDAVVMLDVLHYLPPVDQERMLDRIAAGLPAGGLLLLRVGDATAGWRFSFSQGIDRWVCRALGQGLSRLHPRPLAGWLQALRQRGLPVEARPMSRGTLFANTMLLARKPAPPEHPPATPTPDPHETW